ncbi:MAG: hemolysin family protein [Verrucomicrobiota bacterium]
MIADSGEIESSFRFLLGAGGGSIDVGQGSWLLLVLFFILAIGVSFFCSVWEAVLLSVTRPFVAHLKETNPRAGELMGKLKDDISRPLTAILTLNTVAHTLGSMGVAAQVKALRGGIWEAVAGGVMTLAILILSEIVPKNLGARNWRAWAPWVARSLNVLSAAMGPIVGLIQRFSKGGHAEESFSRDELRVMAEMGRREGELKENESQILTNLLQLRDTKVDDVMTPRTVVFSLPKSLTVGEFLEQHEATPFSRIPVFDKEPDQTDGFVLKDDVLLAAAKDQREIKIGDLRRDMITLLGTFSVTEAFEAMMADRHHVAVVRDEFGGLIGLVTMEDIVETLLGLEIVDEVDTNEDMRKAARRLWEKRAEKMGIELSEEDEPPANERE